jgi:transcriptional regulator with XRE-family HTH domain
MALGKRKALQEIGSRMGKFRKEIKYSQDKMAAFLGLSRSGYSKNETGETFPRLPTLELLSADFDVSMDWLLLNKGPMYYKEKAQPETAGEGKASESEALNALTPDVRELLEYMGRDKLLLHEVLAYFYKYKKKNKEEKPAE